MTLRDDLQAWDGKSSEAIAEIYRNKASQSDFVDQLIQLCSDSALQKGASWLLKHHLESGGSLAPAQVESVIESLDTQTDWETRLHMLQSLPYLDVVVKHKQRLKQFLDECHKDDNKFVRAWALSGLHQLANQHPEYRDEVLTWIERAMVDEAPSVKARLRKLKPWS